ncbi:MAG: type 11 methyltransferase [Methyloligella sp.]|jgi:2-polyprenyl-3-methyl-5-hydroxy-6-metoxy-1,4-benzoquinol methylase|nr:MAG: type 11 methyltransferase [Methyloligella sp.]
MTKTNMRHTYEYEVDLTSDSAPARVINMVGSRKRVLEVGAGPGSITKHLISTNKCDVVALEIDPTAIAKLEEFTDKIYSLDLNDPSWFHVLDDEDRFDIVIAADVLEHVQNPLRTLQGMVSLLRPGGEIILSLPHVGHCTIGACLLAENFRYQDWGLLDRTHIQFFGLTNINDLYENAGLGIIEAQFVVRTPRQTEFLDIWESITETGRQGLLTNPHGFVYQVVSRAKILDPHETAINLMNLAVEVNDPYYSPNKQGPAILGNENIFRKSARTIIRNTLPLNVKNAIRRIGRKCGVNL